MLKQDFSLQGKVQIRTQKNQLQLNTIDEERESEIYIQNIYCSLMSSDLLSNNDKNLLMQSGHLPFPAMNSYTKTLLHGLKDGVVCAYLIHSIDPSVIDISKLFLNNTSSVSKVEQNKIKFNVADNCNKVMNSIKSLNSKSNFSGISLVNIGSEDLINESSDLVKGLIWQLLRLLSVRNISLSCHPELIRLTMPGEKLVDLVSLKGDELLGRWINYHLQCNLPINEVGLTELYCLLKKIVGLYIEYNSSDSEKDSEISRLKMSLDNLNQMATTESGEDMANVLLQETRIFVSDNEVTSELFDDVLFGLQSKDLCGKKNSKWITLIAAKIFNKFNGIYLPSQEELQDLYSERAALNDRIKMLEDQLHVKESDIINIKRASVSETENLLQLLEISKIEKEKAVELRKRDEDKEKMNLMQKLKSIEKSFGSIQKAMIDFLDSNVEKELNEVNNPVSLDEMPSRFKELLTEIFELYYQCSDESKQWKDKYQRMKQVHDIYGEKILEFAENHSPGVQRGPLLTRNPSVLSMFSKSRTVKPNKIR